VNLKKRVSSSFLPHLIYVQNVLRRVLNSEEKKKKEKEEEI
jgi:hypothetical protein